MASETFRYLFSPITVGTLTLRNRIVSTAHATGYVKEGIPSEREVAYQEARGGIGLIIMGAASVHATSPVDEYNLQCYIEKGGMGSCGRWAGRRRMGCIVR